jgi:hypothetical protein
MANNEAQLSRNDGQPEVEIIIGQIKRGDFEIVLYDADGRNPITIAADHNGQAISYKYKIEKPINQLNGSTLIWDVIIGASDTGAGQNWAVTLKITQNGKVVPGGNILNQGQFEIIDHMSDEVRLIVI